MDVEAKSSELEKIPANRRLVEQLYAQAQISKAARDYALGYLYPPELWGLWASRLLLALGVSLVLTGIVYFFAFNSAWIDTLAKLMAIQAGIVGCLIGAYYYSPSSLYGRTLLLSASVLIGVFLAVFGQIYQTGADSYKLFAAWSLLTFGWTLLSNFAAQWLLWLVIGNIALWLWQEAVTPSWLVNYSAYSYMTIASGIALILREYFAMRPGYEWLRPQWLRLVPAVSILVFMLIPAKSLAVSFTIVSSSTWLSGTIGIVGHCLFYYTYRYRRPDIWVLAATVLSSCIILVHFIFHCTLFISSAIDGPPLFMLLALLTLALFTAALVHLRRVAKKMTKVTKKMEAIDG